MSQTDFLSTVQGPTALILITIAIILTTYTVLRQKEMWNEATKTAAAITTVAGIGTFLYISMGEADFARQKMFMAPLQLLKDSPGMYVVPYLVSVVVDQLPMIARREPLYSFFRAAFRIFLVAFILMTLIAAAAAYWDPLASTRLDLSTSPLAFAYRTAVGLPILVFGFLLSTVYFTAFFRYRSVHPVLRTRYLMFAGACGTFPLLIILYAGWPLGKVLNDGRPLISAAILGTMQVSLWAIMAVCWLTAMLIRCKEDDQEKQLHRFETNDQAFDRLTTELSRPYNTSAAEPSIVDWFTCEYLISEAGNRITHRDVNDDDLLAAQLLVALLARLYGTESHTRSFKDHLLNLKFEMDVLVANLPREVPQSRMWRENPALRALTAALELPDPPGSYTLAGQPPWVQLSVLVAAHCNLLPSAQITTIFDEHSASVIPEIWNAYLFAVVSLNWNLDAQPSY